MEGKNPEKRIQRGRETEAKVKKEKKKDEMVEIHYGEKLTEAWVKKQIRWWREGEKETWGWGGLRKGEGG